MRALNTKFELFDAKCVPAWVRGAGMRPSWRLPDWREIQRRPRKYKNSGNEAKNLLKTKDITFLNGANFVFFACKSTRIEASQEQKTPHLAQTNPNLQVARRGGDSGEHAATQDRRDPRPRLPAGRYNVR